MRLYFIRHAQSQNNLLYFETGASRGRSHDPELTEIGQRQAKFLARFIQHNKEEIAPNPEEQRDVDGFRLTHMYTSLMIRAAETAHVVAVETGLSLIGWPDLHETGGIYLDNEITGKPEGLSGCSRSELLARFPGIQLPDNVGENGWWNRPFEVMEARKARAQRVLNELLKRHSGTSDRVAVFSHGGFYNHFLHALQGIPVDKELWYVLNNTGITRIDFSEEGIGVIYLNRVDHLPLDIITN
jgi:2,3-bisphosphoglycerate-dependent phosphoglycerate mutase